MFEVERCNDLFMQNCERARAEEVAKREMRKRVAQENLALCNNSKKFNIISHVEDNTRYDNATNQSKISHATMIR